jgi:hypothetical protein
VIRASQFLGRPAARSVAAAIVLGTLILAAHPAAAFVRYLSESDCPYSWRTRSIAITGYPRGVADLTAEEAATAIEGAVDAWTPRNSALAGCTDLDLKLTLKSTTEVPPTARYDHRNIVAFRTASWCAPKADGSPDPSCREPHDPSALAITSVFARGYGEIVDADIEVNAVTFLWGDLVNDPDSKRQDLQNALTHEVGHFIGLDHTCYMGAIENPPKDQNGEEIPSCDAASSDVKATTMFASAMPGDISKRTLEDDDRAAVCAMYPAGAADVLACPAPDRGGGGCAVAAVDAGPGGGGPARRWAIGAGAGGVLVVAMAWLGARGRASRRRRAKVE